MCARAQNDVLRVLRVTVFQIFTCLWRHVLGVLGVLCVILGLCVLYAYCALYAFSKPDVQRRWLQKRASGQKRGDGSQRNMLCDLICGHGDGWVAMGLTVVGTKLNSESKIVRRREQNRMCRTVKRILPSGKNVFTVRQKKKPYGENVFTVRQNRFRCAVSPANTACCVSPDYKAWGTFSRRKYMLGTVLVHAI